MRVHRGHEPDPETDVARTRELVASVAESGRPALRVWTPPPVVAFGRRDSNHQGYDRAKATAQAHGYPTLTRAVGGHAVAFTGNTVAFARIEPTSDARTGIEARYDRATEAVATALERAGICVECGEPAGAFCPGTHSLSADGKIAGLAQRVHRDVAVVSGILIVRDHEPIAEVLEPVYCSLDIPFDRRAVGSVANAGGSSDPERIIETLIDTFLPTSNGEWVREI